MVCTLLAGVNVVAFAADDLDDTISVQKFYFDATKGGNGEHIYTIDEDEISWYKSLPSWNDEGEAWKAPLFSEVPVYRVANYSTGEHLWITDKGYVDYLVGLGWTQEQGIAFYSDENMGVPVYRLWNGHDGVGSHHFTTDAGEVEWLVGQGWTAEDVAFYGVKEEEPQEFEITATQTGSDEVTILSDVALSEDDEFTLMRGTTVIGVVADVDESGMSATLYTDETIIDAEYTVVVTKADESTASDTFTGESEKLSAIGFVGDQLVLTDTTYQSGMVAIRGFNQFGEAQILDNNLTLYASAGTATYADPTNGVVMVSQTGTNVYVIGSPVVVTAVYKKGTTVLQATGNLTVAAQQAIQSFEFGEIETTIPSYQGLPVTHSGLNTQSYYIPVEAIDQYGNELTAGQLNKMAQLGTLIISPNQAASAFAYVDAQAGQNPVTAFDTLDDGTVVVKVMNGTQPIPGTAVITMVSVGGTSGMTSFEISDDRYIADLDVTIPTLYSGVGSELTIKAVDQFGIEFDDAALYKLGATPNGNKLTFGDKNALTQNGSSIESSGQAGKFKVVENAAKKTLKVIYIPQDYATDTLELFTITSAAPSVDVQNVTVKATSVPKGIKGLPEGTNTVVRDSENATVDLSKVQFTDTYGNLYYKQQNVPAPVNQNDVTEAPKTTSAQGYYYSITAPTNPKTSLNKTTGVVSGTANSGAAIGVDKYTVTLYYVDDNQTVNTLATKQINITNSDGDFVAYTAGFASGMQQPKTMLYAGAKTNAATTDNYGQPTDMAAVALYGIDPAGNAVKMDPNNYKVALRDTKVAGATLAVGTVNGMKVITVSNANTTTIETEDTIVDVYINDMIVASPSLTVSNEKSTPLAFVGTMIVNGNFVMVDPEEGFELNNGAAAVPAATMLATYSRMANSGIFAIMDGSNIGYLVYAVDQYGMCYVENGVQGGNVIAKTPNTIDAATTITLSAGDQSVVIPITIANLN